MRLLFLALPSVLLLGAVGAACSDQTNRSFPTPPDAGVDAPPVEEIGEVTGDSTKGILLVGTVIGENGPYEGQVLVTPDGMIACAEPGTVCEGDPKAAGVGRAFVGIISPGLIDTHNHIMFDIFDGDDWLPLQPYPNHNEWTKEARYAVMVDIKQCLEDASQGKPTWCPLKYDGAEGTLRCEVEKWGELKALAAGTTSIVGLTGTAYPCYGSLIRNIDTQFSGLPGDKIQTSALFPPSKTTADGVCNNYASDKTDAFLIHCGEGIDQKSLDEFKVLGTATTTPECLYAPQTTVTHGTAFTAAEFAIMKAKDMKLTWSPASNMALYGQTTNIPAALQAGLTISLAPDWSMGGSPNMLDELAFAKQHVDANWGGILTSKDLFTMATLNAAKVLALETQIGTIKAGMVADIFAFKGDKNAPYDALVAAKPKDVTVTMIGGKVLYGESKLKALSIYAGACEDFDACGTPKFICVADPVNATPANKQGQTYEEIRTKLNDALADLDTVRPPGGNPFAPVTPVVMCK